MKGKAYLLNLTQTTGADQCAMVEYKEVFDKFSVPTFIIDREYKITDMNKSAFFWERRGRFCM